MARIRWDFSTRAEAERISINGSINGCLTVAKLKVILKLVPPTGGFNEVKHMPTGQKSDDNKKDVLNRLHYAEGHLKAVGKMVESGAYCLDIINQNHAVIEALRKINQMILNGHLGICAWDAVHSKNSSKRKQAVDELINLYAKNN